MSSFTESSSWQDWVDYCRGVDSQREGFDPDESNCPITSWGRSLGDVTFANAIRGASGELAVRACYWFVVNVWNDVPVSLKADVLAIISTEPPIAAIAYQHAETITESERIFLWNAFSDVMPVTRGKLVQMGGAPHG